MKSYACAAMLLAAFSSQANAAPNVVVQPIQLADESIRYRHGDATVDQFSDNGSVQIRPARMDHGSLVFNVAVFNTGGQTANIDVTNFTLGTDALTVNAMTAETLEKKAKSRAAWAQMGLALAGGITAAAAASQRDTYRSTFVTPRAVYRSYYSAPSAIGQVQATAAIAATGVGIASIQSRLDDTLDAIGSQIVQMTTVDPGDSYGGTIIFEKFRFTTLPMRITLNVDWNGRTYPFTFQVAKPGTPVPPFSVAIEAEKPPVAANPKPVPEPSGSPKPTI